MKNTQGSPRTVFISDTTLRDGEQAPGVAFNQQYRMAIAQALDDVGVDEIEIGFAASGPEHRRAMESVVKLGLKARLRSMARPVREDILAASDVGVSAVCIVLGFSQLHLQHKLRISFDVALECIVSATILAKEQGLQVTVALEDATRTSDRRVKQIVKSVSEVGADQISLADTVGIGTPKLIRQKVRVAKQSTNIPIGLHCHDDFGLAIINSLTGIEAGGEFISSTFNRIGERAGNASTECCVCALELLYGYKTNLRLSRLSEVAQMVSRYSGIGIPPNAPIVGSNAFRHESGIHVSAMLRDPRCYEAFDPSLFGAKRQFVLGKTSGRAGLRHFAAAEGVDLPDDLCDIILHRVKEMCDSEMGLQEGALRKLLQETVSLNSVASSTSS